MNEEPKVESVGQGLQALLIGAQILAGAVQDGKSARLLAPLATELRPLLKQTLALAAKEDPDSLPDMEQVGEYLEESIRLIDGGFEKWIINVQTQGLLSALIDLTPTYPEDDIFSDEYVPAPRRLRD